MTRRPRPSLALACTLPFALATAPLAAGADPLPVHTPTRHVASRPSREQRLQVADAVAQVLGQAVPDVINGEETLTRLQSFNPSALACDLPTCAGRIAGPLHARAVALVRQEFSGGSLRVIVDIVSPQGEVTAHAEGDEPVGNWSEAVALGRVVAGRVAVILHPPAAVTAPASAPATHPLAAVAEPRPASPVTPPPGAPPTVVYRRRAWEAGVGGALVVAGAVAVAIGAVAVAQDGSEVSGQSPSPAMHTVYTATGRDYALLGIGIPALIGGAVLVFDGLRAHREELPPGSLALRVGATPLVHGGAVTLGGVF